MAALEPHLRKHTLHKLCDWFPTYQMLVVGARYDSDSEKEGNPWYHMIGWPEAAVQTHAWHSSTNSTTTKEQLLQQLQQGMFGSASVGPTTPPPPSVDE